MLNSKKMKTVRNTAFIIGGLYSLYLLKTLMGINLSHSYSAKGILKAPLQPIKSNSTELCQEFQTLCKIRTKIRHKFYRMKQA
jgi:hypothetical protein